MKWCWVWIVLLLLCGLPTAQVALAEGDSDVQSQLGGYVDSNLQALDLSDFEAFCRSLGAGDNVRDTLSALIRGRLSLTPRQLGDLVWDSVTRAVAGVLPSLVVIVLIATLFNLLTGLTQHFLRRQTADMVYFVCYAAVLSVVVTLVVRTLTSVRSTVDTLVDMMNVVTPPLMTLTVAVGGNVTASVFQPQLALVSTLVADVIGRVILPLFIASVVFAVAGNLSDNVRLDKLQSATRYLIGVVLAAVFGLFTAYLTAAGIAGSMADTMSVRAARYVIGSYVPLVGGYISQGFDLVTASVHLIKNALGVYAMGVVLSVVLVPLAQLVVLTVGLKLTAGIIEPIGDRRMASFVGGVAECMRALVAAVAGVGFTFLVTLLMVMCSLTMVL